MHLLLKRINLYFNKRRVAIYLVFCLIVGCIAEEKVFGDRIVAKATASKILSMTELYTKGNVGSGLAAGDVVTIGSKEELEMFREYVDSNNSMQYVTFRQTADIVMSDYTFQYDETSGRTGFYLEGELLGTVSPDGGVYENYTTVDETTLELLGITNSQQKSWNPIGNSDSHDNNVFLGSYDGNGYTISGLWCVSKENNVGLFSYITGEKVYNVTLKNSLFVGANHVGGIAGTLMVKHGFDKDWSALITNCSVETIIIGAERCGGIVGYIDGSYGSINSDVNDDKIVKNCVVQGIIQGDTVGGCIGENWLGEISFCEFVGENSLVLSEAGISGGIAGRMSRGNINNCRNYGKVVGNKSGGIVGIGGDNISEDKGVWQCENYGIIKGEDSGGIIGYCSGKCYGCINYGKSNGRNAGGIVGLGEEDTWIADCENRGDFEKINSTVGGIIGTGTGNSKIQNCLNKGDFSCEKSSGSVGGIVGNAYSDNGGGILIQNGLNLGAFNATENALDLYSNGYGQIGGYALAEVIKNCYYLQGDVPCVGNTGAIVQACYPVTGSQIRGTEQIFRICEEKGSYAYTTSVMEALNNAVVVINGLNAAKEEGVICLQQWKLDEEGYPTICNIGVGAMREGSEITISPEATISPEVEVPATMSAVDSSSSPPKKVTGFTATPKAPKKVKLTWNVSEGAQSYEIYRSKKKKKGYRLVKTVVGKTRWTDKKVKKGKKYFYKIKACKGEGVSRLRSGFSKVKKVKQPWHATPKVRYTKGTLSDNTKCIIIQLKKYQGTHVEIQIKRKGKKYQKFPLQDSRIKSYKGVFRLTYSKGGQTLTCRVRTFRYSGKKKRYSLYTKAKKIRL